MIFRILYFVMCITCAFSNRPRIYRRIPRFLVADSVYTFINENRLTNCFEFLENDNQLLLKCWRDNKLVDAEINIIDRSRKSIPYYPALSVVI